MAKIVDYLGSSNFFHFFQVFLKVTRAAELGEDILPEVMSVFTAESFAAHTDRELRNNTLLSVPQQSTTLDFIPRSNISQYGTCF